MPASPRLFRAAGRRRLAAVGSAAAVAIAAAGGVLAATPAAQAGAADEAAFLYHLNALRASHGLPMLAVSADLTAIAEQHSGQMLAANSIFHNTALTSTVSNWQVLGENVGMGPSVTAIDSAFDNSPEHYANEVNPAYTEVGIGSVTSSAGEIFVTVDFREPMYGASPAPAPLAPPAPAPPATPPANLYAIARSGTASGRVEVHELSQPSGYTQFAVHAATALSVADPGNWQFVMAPFGRDGAQDLFAIHWAGTASGQVEVHVLSAASGYQQYLLHAATALPAVPAGQWQFRVAATGGDQGADLVAVHYLGTASGRTEVHTLSGASGYHSWINHRATALGTVEPGTWDFLVGDPGGQGDLVGVERTGTASGHTELHSLSAASGFTQFTLHRALPLSTTPQPSAEFSLTATDPGGDPDLALSLLQGTASGQTELHVLTGTSSYTAFGVHAATGLGTADPAAWGTDLAD